MFQLELAVYLVLELNAMLMSDVTVRVAQGGCMAMRGEAVLWISEPRTNGKRNSQPSASNVI